MAKKCLIFLMIVMLFVLSACSTATNAPANTAASTVAVTTSSTEATATVAATATVSATASAAATEAASTSTGSLSKYDPMITVTAGVLDQSKSAVFKPGETMQDNSITKEYKDVLGIDLKYVWLEQTQDQLTQKVALSMASGDIPDIMQVRDPVLVKQLQQAGLLWQMDDIVDKYAIQSVKDYLNVEVSGIKLIDSAKIDGKLYCIPNLNNPADFAPMMFIRVDWLKKLNLPEPKSMSDVITIAKAFATGDPDSNGKNDTYGIAIAKTLYENLVSITGFANSFHANPTSWIKTADGSLAYGSIQPEMKNALAALQDLFKAGAIDPEFGAEDSSKVKDNITAGKFGIEFGAWWNVNWPLGFSWQNNPNADWKAYPLMSVDNNPAQATGKLGAGTYYVVSKKCEHPEALIQFMNLYDNYRFQQPAKLQAMMTDGNGAIGYGNLLPFWIAHPGENYLAYTNITAALDKNDVSQLTDVGYQKPIYDAIVKWRSGDRTSKDLTPYNNEFQFDANGSIPTLMNMEKNNGFMVDQFYGSPTATMKGKWAALQDEELTTFTKIILGSSPISDFDKFVANWKKLGGDQITQEVNDWAKSK